MYIFRVEIGPTEQRRHCWPPSLTIFATRPKPHILSHDTENEKNKRDIHFEKTKKASLSCSLD